MSSTAPSSAVALGTPVAAGLRWVNFVNGRLLTGDDLAGEQDSADSARLLLGTSIGAGVVQGLTVTEDSGPGNSASATTAPAPAVTVTAGLAVNSLGQPLPLDADIQLSLAEQDQDATTSAATPTAFEECNPPPPTAVITGGGVYVLLIGPARTSLGSAQLSGETTVDAGLTVGYLVDQVQFRLAAVTGLSSDVVSNPTTAQNLVAYQFLGTAASTRRAFDADPLSGSPVPYGLLDGMLSAGTIAASEVPLAVIWWTSTAGFQFVDMWSVRRRIVRPSNESGWAPVVEDRALAEGEAMFLQFQDQIGGANGATALGQAAGQTFAYMPPAGVVPLSAFPAFFDGLTTRGPLFMNAARVDQLLRDSYAFPPIDTTSGEMIWLYQICDNALPPPVSSQPVLLFTSGHIQYRANAQFDLSYFDYADYAINAI